MTGYLNFRKGDVSCNWDDEPTPVQFVSITLVPTDLYDSRCINVPEDAKVGETFYVHYYEYLWENPELERSYRWCFLGLFRDFEQVQEADDNTQVVMRICQRHKVAYSRTQTVNFCPPREG